LNANNTSEVVSEKDDHNRIEKRLIYRADYSSTEHEELQYKINYSH